MLVLSRHVNQDIIIGDPKNPIAIIRICDVNGDKVRVGVIAAREIPVNRSEFFAEQAAKETANATTRNTQEANHANL